MRYDKPFLTFEEQADQLIARGMEGSRPDLVTHLSDVGYYRLSGYWHIFKNDDDAFRGGTSFAKVWDIYVFDRQLRLVTLDAIERVEVYFRTQLAHELARESGAFGFASRESLPRLDERQYDKFMRKCAEKAQSSREPFALHFRQKYGDCHALPPYWMLVNMMDFGQMLTLYRGASVETRARIAEPFGVSSRVLESWLTSLNTVRNICAHHGRLWNRVLGTRPMIPNANRDPRWHDPFKVGASRLFGILTILSYLLERVAPDTGWRGRLFSLMGSHPDIDIAKMGFESGWEKCPFWERWL